MEEENSAPVAANDHGFTAATDSLFTILSADLLQNDTDADGDDLTITTLYNAFNCNVSLNEEGNIVFRPDIEFSGIARFSYIVTDNNGGTSTAFAAVKVGDTNTEPLLLNQIENQNVGAEEDVNFTIPANTFVDLEGDDLTYSAGSAFILLSDDSAASDLPELSPLPEWLTFNAGTQTFSGTPPENFDGFVAVEVRASDGINETSTFFSFDIVSGNSAPVLDNELANQTSAEDTELSFTIPEDAFSDPDDDDLTYTAGLAFLPQVARAFALGIPLSPLPDWLSFDADSRTFSGTPPQDFHGSLLITVVASDGSLETYDTFTLNITAVNDAPIVANELEDQTSEEDTAINFTIPEDAFSDVDNFNLTLSAQESVDGGSPLPEWLSFDADSRTFSGTPPQDFVGLLELVVTASDGELTVSDTFFLEITPVNDAPVANDDEGFEATAGTALTIAAADLLENDTDVDGGRLFISSVISSEIANVSLDEDGNVVYTATGDYEGDDSFTYTVSDGNGGSATATVSVSVEGGSSNSAPVLDNELADQTSEEDAAISFTIPSDAFSDPDDDDLTYTATLAEPIIAVRALNDGLERAPLPEWLTFDPDTLTFSGTPPQDYNGSLNVTVTASDGELESSDTFTLEITAVNDAPVLDNALEDQTSKEDAAVNFTIPGDAFSDPDGDELTYTATLAVPIIIIDDVTVTTAAASDGPALPDWLTFDPDTLTFSGTPPQDYNGSLDVTVTASDGELEVSDTFTLEITPVNDAPELDNPLADQTFEEDTEVSFTIPSDAFSDPDDDELTYTASLAVPIITLSDAGVSAAAASDGPALPDWLTFDPDTLTFSGTPPQDYNGTIDVTVTASDGELEVSDTFTLEITAVNDGPVAVDDEGIEADAGTALTIAAADLLANDTDVEGDELTITSVESTSGNATVSLDGDGNVVYTASDDFDGDDSFTYTISDGNGGTSTASVSVSVEGDQTDPYEGWQVGTEGRDYLYGSFYSSNQIYGDDGNDRIYGGVRSDQLDGGEGNDRIYGRWGNDIINGDEGHDRIYGGSGRDTLNGGEGNDTIYGSWGNDTLNGDAGNDRLSGGSGNDTLNGGEGNDELWGGWGQDNFVFSTGDGNDTVRDFSTTYAWWWFRSAGDSITLNVDGIDSYEDVLDAASQNGRHTTFDFGDGDSLTLRYTRLSSLDQDDFTIL